MSILDSRLLIRFAAAGAEAASESVEKAGALANASSAGGRAASNVVAVGLLVDAGLLDCGIAELVSL